VDTERQAGVGPALSCSAESVGWVSVREALGTLLATREEEGPPGVAERAVVNTGAVREDASGAGRRPDGTEGALQVGGHGGCAVAWRALTTGPAALAGRVFSKSASR